MNNYICTNKTINYKEEVEKIINSKKQEILDFFEVNDNNQFTFDIYIYDTIEDLVKGMRERGFDDMPSYMCACHKDEDNSLNFFEPSDIPNENEWSKDEYENVIYHELIHGIQYTIYGTQPEWLTEGVAKYLDGTYKSGIKYLLQNYINGNRIPPIEELEEEFGLFDYDSYDYAYLMVSYLIDTQGKKEFLEIISDKNKLTEMSNDLPNKAINYYNEMFFSKRSNK